MEKVQIPKEQYMELERLRYEYNSTLSVLNYLMHQEDIKQEEIFEQIIVRCETRQIALDLYEKTLASILRPSIEYRFKEIDYENEVIIYEIEKMEEDN